MAATMNAGSRGTKEQPPKHDYRAVRKRNQSQHPRVYLALHRQAQVSWLPKPDNNQRREDRRQHQRALPDRL